MTLRSRIESFIRACPAELSDGEQRWRKKRDQLLLELARYQYAHNLPYQRFLNAWGVVPDAVGHVEDIPALPTDVYRYCAVACFDVKCATKVFHTSGTTAQESGKHFFRDLGSYDLAAKKAAQQFLLDGMETQAAWVILAPTPLQAPHSSLAYMLHRLGTWFGDELAYVWRDNRVDIDALVKVLNRLEKNQTPVLMLGTSFAFVMAEDALGARTWSLARGSRIMQTGGFKGRTREIGKEEMLQVLSRRYGLPYDSIFSEYGMTELSSQMYEQRTASYPRVLRVPAWVRLSVVNPTTQREVRFGEQGLVRIDDMANVESCAFVQTSDVGIQRAQGIELLGRAQGALPRGCSLLDVA